MCFVCIAFAFAVVGWLAGWNFAETPLVILTLPLSVVPMLFKPPPPVLIAACGLTATAIWAGLRSLGKLGAAPTTGGPGEMRAVRALLTALVATMIALWAITSAASVAVFVNSHWFGPWPKLRVGVADFPVPSGLHRFTTFEAGSEACFVSCNEPRISVVLKTTLPPNETCRAIETSIRAAAEDVGPPTPYMIVPPHASCFFEGRLPEVYSNARLSGVVLSAKELKEFPWLTANADGILLEGEETVVALLFNSGI